MVIHNGIKVVHGWFNKKYNREEKNLKAEDVQKVLE